MFRRFRIFGKSESGAISTDWVLLTAGVVGLAGASTLLINDSVVSVSSTIGEAVREQPLGAVN